MPKFSAYLRGEGTIGPTGPTGPQGVAGSPQKVLFDVDVSSGYLYMYTDIDILTQNKFTLDETGHLLVEIT